MKTLSLYCGGGGIDEGLRQVGLKTTLAIDYDKDSCETIKLNHPDTEVICGKVSDYLESFRGFDVIVGGPPCPEFSRANTNRTFDMCEVNNFWQIVENNRPEYFLMENVQDVKKKLYKASYLVNCADYGVPQTRLRRFFTNLALPKPTHAERPIQNFYGTELKRWVSVKEALEINENDLFLSITGFSGCNQIEKTKSLDYPSRTVLASHVPIITNYRVYSNKYLQEKNPIMFAKHKPNLIDKPVFTITAKDRNSCSEMITNQKICRKLANHELQILQGFPKSYRFFGNKTSVRKQIGNAVPPPVIREFFKAITTL